MIARLHSSHLVRTFLRVSSLITHPCDHEKIPSPARRLRGGPASCTVRSASDRCAGPRWPGPATKPEPRRRWWWWWWRRWRWWRWYLQPRPVLHAFHGRVFDGHAFRRWCASCRCSAPLALPAHRVARIFFSASRREEPECEPTFFCSESFRGFLESGLAEQQPEPKQSQRLGAAAAATPHRLQAVAERGLARIFTRSLGLAETGSEALCEAECQTLAVGRVAWVFDQSARFATVSGPETLLASRPEARRRWQWRRERRKRSQGSQRPGSSSCGGTGRQRPRHQLACRQRGPGRSSWWSGRIQRLVPAPRSKRSECGQKHACLERSQLGSGESRRR